MKSLTLPTTLLLATLLLPWGTALAERADRDKPMNIESDALRYDDARRAASRRLRLADDCFVAVRLSGSVDALASGDWLLGWMQEGRPVADIRRHLLMPSRQAPAGYVPAGRIVCQCHGVSETAISASLAQSPGSPAERLAAAQAKTSCGTNCGSCLPELRRMASQAPSPVPERHVA